MSFHVTESSEPQTNVMPGVAGGLLRLAQAAHDVVIGQREDIDAALRRTRDDRRRRKQAVGMGRMAVEVVARHRSRNLREHWGRSQRPGS